MQIVEVEWVDSAFHRGWSDKATKTREMTLSDCRTVGYLVTRDKNAISVTLSTANDGESLADSIAIPTVAVKRVRYLR